MANLGIKVETVLRKFYDVQQDDEIKGLYVVRSMGDSSGEILWYFFNSNNATYHNPKKSSTSNVVIRDINQSNSAYLGRLKAAFKKANEQDKKIFWLVLVYGDGIGLSPDGYDWLASIEPKVSFDTITASLTMRTFPMGKSLEGFWTPCCKRVEQDKYFNTTFISCKDENGQFTNKYMEHYFSMYDSRPYREVLYNVVKAEYKDDKEYTVEELGNILKHMYNNAENGMQKASIYIFGMKFGEYIILKGYKAAEIIKASTLAESYATELNNALNIYKCLDKNLYGVSISNRINDADNTKSVSKKDEMVFAANLKSDYRRNRIIFGAPGTGKSFKLNEDKTELLENGGDYERVTFHANYSYANFVGTYKPVMVENKRKLALNDEKKRIISILQDKTKTAQEKYDLLYDEFKDDGLTRLPILLGIYSDEKFETRKANGTDTADNNNAERNHGRAIRQYINLSDESLDKKEIAYEYVPGPFIRVLVKALKSAMSDNPKPYLLIVEEINRANPAAVFGDVFQLLDRDSNGVSEYSISTSQDMRAYLAQELEIDESAVETIKIPNNMFIWATMNSADQGVFPMDTAFKRRWDFEYLGVDAKEEKVEKYVIPVGKGDNRKYVYWNELRVAINDKLSSEECKVNEDKLLGPFFISTAVLENALESLENQDAFIKTFESKILMYLFEDAMKMSPKKIFTGHADKGGRMIFSKICEAFEEFGIGIFGLDVKVYDEPPKNE